MDYALEARNVAHSYGRGTQRVRVLDGFSLSVETGAFDALMGPSGSGKSTFLHLAAGLIAPDSGSIRVGGTEIAGLSDSAAAKFRRRRIGVVFQDFNLLESLTVAENIVLPAKLDGVRPDRARLDGLLSALGLEKLRDKRPGSISGGERQRAAIARALFRKPGLILADEPTGNLDSAAARSLCALLSDLNKSEKCAILLVTHDPIVAASAGKVHFLKDGKIAGTRPTGGDPDAVARAYMETCK